MFNWSFTSPLHFGHLQFLILATPMDTAELPRTDSVLLTMYVIHAYLTAVGE